MLRCLIVDDEPVSQNTIKHFISQTDFLEVAEVCDSAVQALKVLAKGNIDLVFLDIEMPEMSGMDLLETAKIVPEVIITTSKPEYALKAYDYDVIDFLQKPIEFPRFLKAAQRAKEYSELQTEKDEVSEQIFVKSDAKIVRLNYADILFVEALADYVVINTPTGKHIVHSTMKGIASKLPSDLFSRVHRSYIVNMKKIDVIEDMTISIATKPIPIGASYKEPFFSKLNML